MATEIHLVVDDIRSMFNVGAMFRACDIFGVKKLYLGGYTACPPRKEISKTALFADEYVPWEHNAHTWRIVDSLQKNGIHVAAIETEHPGFENKFFSLPDFEPPRRIALLLGNEVRGLPESLLKRVDSIVEIPMYGQKDSLNIAVAAGVALYDIREKLNRLRPLA